MLNKIFGSKKKDDYYLEFGDAQDKKAPPAESKPAPKAESAKPVEAKPQTAAVAKPQTTSVAPAAPKPAPAKEPTPLNTPVKTPAGMNFSTEYLMPQASTPRRRPGPSLGMFTDMANQMNRS
ncbi:hypothetical protein [Planktothrix paucivesiculata]|uniref:Uncharacterized protein n=1 Tax=Planktothrix paucivesiculata PCC 9631 TaxID=671071 RepID=A0A7Z9E172_9CYAN|nr:hypothetical protein [Planktothrix paucivesiculata]VXD20596.1 conserved hypothetical protein [Planktothrix paucivesiculata PCC 9631]